MSNVCSGLPAGMIKLQSFVTDALSNLWFSPSFWQGGGEL